MGIGLRIETGICRSMDRGKGKRERDKDGDRRDKGGSRETGMEEGDRDRTGLSLFHLLKEKIPQGQSASGLCACVYSEGCNLDGCEGKSS